MKVTFAQFNVEYDGKSYGVQMGVQYVTQNSTFTTVTIYAVNDGVKRIVRNFSTSGRQVISPSNAKRFLRDALIAEGTIKERVKPGPDLEAGVELERAILGNEKNVGNYAGLFDEKTSGGPIHDNRPTPGILMKIRKLFT